MDCLLIAWVQIAVGLNIFLHSTSLGMMYVKIVTPCSTGLASLHVANYVPNGIDSVKEPDETSSIVNACPC